MDKEQYDIVKGAINVFAANILDAFMDWVQDRYIPSSTFGTWIIKGESGWKTSNQIKEQFLQEIIKPIETVNL